MDTGVLAVKIQAIVRGNLARQGQLPLAERVYRRLCGKLNDSQKAIVVGAALVLATFVIGTLVGVSSGSALETMRDCAFCRDLNCVEIDWFSGNPWWSCCMATLPGSCLLSHGPGNHSDELIGLCNITGLPVFNASCDMSSDSRCRWDPSDPASSSVMCQRLCFNC